MSGSRDRDHLEMALSPPRIGAIPCRAPVGPLAGPCRAGAFPAVRPFAARRAAAAAWTRGIGTTAPCCALTGESTGNRGRRSPPWKPTSTISSSPKSTG